MLGGGGSFELIWNFRFILIFNFCQLVSIYFVILLI